ncbi:GmrSD restriction endonuclease domain-containing protein [Streptomyces rubiginosohelvolus]|uniref:GmrSD restriction endonuclease domain-containing protein n=1 Tax=Streptomyces rubiginosohelvolus TaxID=67362 RepID=UPI003812C119
MAEHTQAGGSMGLANQKIASQIEDLLQGKVVIPSIQRDFVWMRPDVRDLFDSLYRGYPVGALLLWKTNLTVPFKTAAVVQADKSAHQPLYLLDGQQRLTSLAWVYRPESKADGRLIDLRFDVRTEEFVNPSAIQSKDPLLFRVSTLLQENVQYHEVLKEAGIDYSAPQFGAWMQRLQKVYDIRKQEIAVITYESDDYEEVAELFARLNKGGRRLSKGDLVYSAIAARWSDGLDTMDAFHQELQDSNFALNREAVLRLTSLLAGTGAHHIKLIGADMDEAALKDAWHATERALRFAIDFLKGECAIPRSEVLSSPNVTIVPALLLHHRDGKLRPGEAQLLRRWVYTAMAFSHYSLQVEGKLDSEARLIKSREGEGLFAELIRRASGTRSRDSALHPRDLEQKYSTHPFFKLLYIAALRGTARDWATNIAISDQPMNSGAKIEFHHVFPRARVQGTYAKEEWNSLANLAFVTGQTNKMISSGLPVDYMAGIAPERLAEQWIPGDPELRSLDRFPDFLAARRSLLANVLNELLGLPSYDAQVIPRDIDELPGDEQLIVEGPTAPTLVGAEAQELRTKRGVEIHAVYEGQRVDAYYDPLSRVVSIPSGPGRGEYETPSGAAVAVVHALNPHVNPNRNGWNFWTVTATGRLLQSIR